jgi:hypothetical protein
MLEHLRLILQVWLRNSLFQAYHNQNMRQLIKPQTGSVTAAADFTAELLRLALGAGHSF